MTGIPLVALCLRAVRVHNATSTGPKIRRSDEAVLLALAEHRNTHTGQCTPGPARLAAWADCSPGTAGNAIIRLRETDFLTPADPADRAQKSIDLDHLEALAARADDVLAAIQDGHTEADRARKRSTPPAVESTSPQVEIHSPGSGGFHSPTSGSTRGDGDSTPGDGNSTSPDVGTPYQPLTNPPPTSTTHQTDDPTHDPAEETDPATETTVAWLAALGIDRPPSDDELAATRLALAAGWRPADIVAQTNDLPARTVRSDRLVLHRIRQLADRTPPATAATPAEFTGLDLPTPAPDTPSHVAAARQALQGAPAA